MSTNLLYDFFAGWVSGIAAILVGQPLDTIKVYQQVFGISGVKATQAIYSQAGITGFYKGMTLPLISSGVLNSLYFGVYGGTLQLFEHKKRWLVTRGILDSEYSDTTNVDLVEKRRGSYWEIFAAGCVAGSAQIPISCPGELIRIHCQTAAKLTGKPASSFKVVQEILQLQGLKGFYRGWVPMCFRDIPSAGLYILTYEFLKDTIVRITGERPTSTHQFIAGGFAGSACWMFVIPFDIVKSRMQAHSFETKYDQSLSTSLKQIIKEEGYLGLCRGMIPISIRAFPVNAVTFVVYEYVYKLCADSFGSPTPIKNKSDICAQIQRDCLCQKF